MSWLRITALAAVALLPAFLKPPVLRSVFGFRIGRRVRIGLALLDCRDLAIGDDASIGHGVLFRSCGRVEIGEHAGIGPLNVFRGGTRIRIGAYARVLRLNVINAIPGHDCHGTPDSVFDLGYGAFLASSHWIDFTDRVSIGRRSMLAGRSSSIWTHNRKRAAPVQIGDFCYVGSEVRIAPGVTLADGSMVALGAVVTSSFAEPFTFIGGSPARVARRLNEGDTETLLGKTRPDLPDEPVPVLPREGDPREGADEGVDASIGRVSEQETLEPGVRRIVAHLAKIDPSQVAFDARLVEQGIDSLQLIVLRETLERELGLPFSDDAWMGVHTPGDILRDPRVGRGSRAQPVLVPRAGPVDATGAQASTLARFTPGLAIEPLEIGMPLTGRNHLAETPLLQRLGDQRWRHISAVMGVPSREIVDDEGARLYATFFYVEMAFPPARPMGRFGENDRFTIVSSLARYGTSMLDGISCLMPPGFAGETAPFASLDDAVAAGVPAARLSNIFVKQFAGAEWLKKGRPAESSFAQIPELAEAPDSYVTVKQAEKAGRFGSARASWVPMTKGPMRREYALIPDRDLNGAGLVYFANYPMFLDICERDVLLSAELAMPEALVDRRTLVRRRSAYLNNASARDRLIIEIEPWLELARTHDGAPAGPITLHVSCRMHRQSDARLMMVSSAEKTILDASISDWPIVEALCTPALSKSRNVV